MARVLVVEDDADVRALIERRLGAARHQVIAVDSAEAALKSVDERGMPDVAVLDVRLPGMSGTDLAPLLRSRASDTALRVIFLTADVLPHQIAAGRAHGATYLTKPFVTNALLKAVDAALADIAGPGSW